MGDQTADRIRQRIAILCHPQWDSHRQHQVIMRGHAGVVAVRYVARVMVDPGLIAF